MDKNIEPKILEALESVRPFLKRDNGDIELVEIRENTVYVKLLGNCQGCPISYSTMKLGVENVIKQYVPTVQKVVNLSE